MQLNERVKRATELIDSLRDIPKREAQNILDLAKYMTCDESKESFAPDNSEPVDR